MFLNKFLLSAAILIFTLAPAFSADYITPDEKFCKLLTETFLKPGAKFTDWKLPDNITTAPFKAFLDLNPILSSEDALDPGYTDQGRDADNAFQKIKDEYLAQIDQISYAFFDYDNKAMPQDSYYDCLMKILLGPDAKNAAVDNIIDLKSLDKTSTIIIVTTGPVMDKFKDFGFKYTVFLKGNLPTAQGLENFANLTDETVKEMANDKTRAKEMFADKAQAARTAALALALSETKEEKSKI